MFRFHNSQGELIRVTPRTIVVKVGSGVLCGPDRRLDEDYIDGFVGTVCGLLDRGVDVALVSSGAIAAGMGGLGVARPSRSIPVNQAYAAVGQRRLMQVYGEAFGRRGKQVAQVLLTRPDLEDRRRYLNARRCFEALLAMKVTPIVNENDTTVVEEIKFGGNDTLSAIIATKLKADFLILLTNVDGVFDKNPATHDDVRLIPIVERPEEIEDGVATAGKSDLGTGGMASKVAAARMAAEGGVYSVIANGRDPKVLEGLTEGRLSGTLFLANRERRLSSWANWILSAPEDTRRQVVVDAGARAALVEGKKSLLPAGVRDVRGEFQQGEVVDVIEAASDKRFARGVTNYSSEELRKIQGLKSSQIEPALGYKLDSTAVHRDNLIVLR